jgi:hypothetical protein
LALGSLVGLVLIYPSRPLLAPPMLAIRNMTTKRGTIGALRSLWGRPPRRQLGSTQCALCRNVIARESLSHVVDKGASYHATCWRWKVRRPVEEKQSA